MVDPAWMRNGETTHIGISFAWNGWNLTKVALIPVQNHGNAAILRNTKRRFRIQNTNRDALNLNLATINEKQVSHFMGQ